MKLFPSVAHGSHASNIITIIIGNKNLFFVRYFSGFEYPKKSSILVNYYIIVEIIFRILYPFIGVQIEIKLWYRSKLSVNFFFMFIKYTIAFDEYNFNTTFESIHIIALESNRK